MPDRPAAADRPAPRPRLAPAPREAAAAAAFAAAVLLFALPALVRDGGEVPAAVPLAFRFDANAATAAQWELLPRVGPVLAARLAGGRYDRPEDLLAVRGVGPRTLEDLRPWLRFPAPGRPPGESAAGEPWRPADAARWAAHPAAARLTAAGG